MIPLLPLALGLLPELAKWVTGDKGGQVAEAVVNVVRTVTGTDNPSDAEAAIANNPEMAARVRIEIAQIVAAQEDARHQAQLAAIRADLDNTASARNMTVELSKSGSIAHYSSSILSAIVLIMFGGMTYLVVTKGLPEGAREQSNILLGTLATLAGTVVNYWLGSSLGSTLKSFGKTDKPTT